ncbi:MAG: hypothetical protein ABJC13_24715 [Acidobacteriota bacterium]
MMRRDPLGRLWGWRDGSLPALLFFGLEAGAIHAGVRRLGFVGDSWAILMHAAPGWRAALGTPLGYHYIPLASGWTRLLYMLLGDHERLYAIVNIGELTVVGWLTFLLGRRLLGKALPGLLAGSLLIGSAAFPDVTYWALVGNFHCLAAIFSIGAIAAAAALAEENPPRGASLGFAAALAGACFTYEGMITLLPVALIWCLVRQAERAGARSLFRVAALQGMLRRFAWSLPVVAALVLAKIRFAQATASAITPALDLERLHSLAHGLIGIFTLRSSSEVLETLLYIGTTPMSIEWHRILVFLGLALALGVWTFLRARRGAALLVLWLAIHLFVAILALPLSSRHCFLPSIPGLLLLSLGFCQVGEWVSRRVAPAPGTVHMALAIPLVLTSVLILSAQGELHRAQELYRRSFDALRVAVEQARTLLPSRNTPATLTLVNFPAYLVEGGIAVPAFDNAMNGLALFRLGGTRIELIHTWVEVPGWVATDSSRLVDEAEVLRRGADPFRAVVAFELGP